LIGERSMFDGLLPQQIAMPRNSTRPGWSVTPSRAPDFFGREHEAEVEGQE
jgi:hypothetical protein